MGDKFSPATAARAAKRAAYICSNPSCHRMTLGPDKVDKDKSISTGRASHIKAASEGGPRYDPGQSSAQRKSVANAIWLCGTCADLIDKNQGGGYPISQLEQWKDDHEILLKKCLEGEKRVIFQFGVRTQDRLAAGRVLFVLKDKGFLFAPYPQENHGYVIRSMQDLRASLSAISGQIEHMSKLDIVIDSVIGACRHYMNSTPENVHFEEMNDRLSAVRKIVGMNVAEICSFYDLDPGPDLVKILPSAL